MIQIRRIFFTVSMLFLLRGAGFGIETTLITDPKTGKQMKVAADRILVRFKQGTSGAKKASARFSVGATLAGTAADKQVDVLKVSTATLVSTLRRFQSDPDVEFAEPDGVYEVFATANDPLLSAQYGHSKIELFSAWDKLAGASAVKVAVVDNGVDYTHEDFGGGWQCSTCTVYDGYDFGDNDTNPMGNIASLTDHGTQVAGVIASVADNSLGLAGVAKNLAKILAVKVADNATGTMLSSNISLGIDYAVNQSVKVINLSLGSSFPSSTIQTSINRALAANITVVAAAGNGGNNAPVSYPAAFPGVIAVAASDSLDRITSFSQAGPEIAVAAPGSGVAVPYPGNTYTTSDGTSFSSPYVAGVAALILAIRPSLTPSQVKSIITTTADDLAPAGFDNLSGYGRLNANNALSGLPRGAPPEDVTVPMPNPFIVAGVATVTFRIPLQIGGTVVATKILDVKGTPIRTLTGSNVWDGKNDDGNTVSSGVYLYELETTAGKSRNKVFLVR